MIVQCTSKNEFDLLLSFFLPRTNASLLYINHTSINREPPQDKTIYHLYIILRSNKPNSFYVKSFQSYPSDSPHPPSWDPVGLKPEGNKHSWGCRRVIYTKTRITWIFKWRDSGSSVSKSRCPGRLTDSRSSMRPCLFMTQKTGPGSVIHFGYSWHKELGTV